MKNIVPFKIFETKFKESSFTNFTVPAISRIKKFLMEIPKYEELKSESRIISSFSSISEKELVFSGDTEVQYHDFKLGDDIDCRVYKIVNDYGRTIFRFSFRENRPIPSPPVVSFKLFTKDDFDVESYLRRFEGDWKSEIWDFEKIKKYFLWGRIRF